MYRVDDAAPRGLDEQLQRGENVRWVLEGERACVRGRCRYGAEGCQTRPTGSPWTRQGCRPRHGR